jgi:diguanylate cyclase (GGDEF)-like protein/PAS domain S-box-containing protein
MGDVGVMPDRPLSARLIDWSHEGPMFERRSLGPRVAPFAFGAVAVVVPLVFFPPTSIWTFLIGAALGGLCLVVALVAPWHRLPKLAEATVPVIAVVAIAFVRDGTGGHVSGYSALMLLAVLWVSVYGTPSQLAITIGAVFLALAIPVVQIGDPAYPAGEWRRIPVIMALSVVMGWIVMSLVSAVRREALATSRSALRLEEQTVFTRQVVESASQAVITIDDLGRIIELNPAAARLVGRSADELIGSNGMVALLTPERAARARPALEALVSGERPSFSIEAEIVRPDGATVPIEVWLSASGEPAARRVHVFARDITDRRRADARAEEHLADLERILVAARTLSTSTNAAEARQTICTTACSIAGSDVAFYFERDPATGLVACTGSTIGLPRDVGVDQERSFVAAHFENRHATFVPNLAAAAQGDGVVAAQVGVAAAHWQPVLNGEVLLGVLVLGWSAPDPVMDGRARSLMEVLATQVAGALARVQLVEQLQEMARTDPLTGLMNRRAMTDALERDIAGSRSRLRPMSIAIMDLDYFKAFNDRFGHQSGDRLLVAAARRWTAELRPMDGLARYGGEEFLVLLPGCDIAAARSTADRLRAAVPEGQTCSVGIAQWDGSETSTALIARADTALYAAKAAGRDVTVASERATGPDVTAIEAEPTMPAASVMPLAS